MSRKLMSAEAGGSYKLTEDGTYTLRCHTCKSAMLFKCSGHEIVVHHECPDQITGAKRETMEEAARLVCTECADGDHPTAAGNGQLVHLEEYGDGEFFNTRCPAEEIWVALASKDQP